jgi:hypothetical protein
MPRMLHTVAIALLLGSMPLAGADELIIEKLEVARVEMPSRGMTMERVQERFGAPQSRLAAVGDPPITRWEYPDFVVVFEHRHVVHSVERRHRPARPAT